jgi:hypothetical protein
MEFYDFPFSWKVIYKGDDEIIMADWWIGTMEFYFSIYWKE